MALSSIILIIFFAGAGLQPLRNVLELKRYGRGCKPRPAQAETLRTGIST
jgi:hypothetical protein